MEKYFTYAKINKKGLKHGLFFTKLLYSPEVYSLSGG